ncbi:ABC transporter ATP-binding protein [Desulfomonile tiedjei]|uniref:ABC-type branched-chain amino acid transport systems, ATPase component n=1 Tax=Desulfomonile tiedjei (strain ATCC 49306 / DSM 6799 / DCB-1) TaxID=706587 RepID=I4C8D5_DESTA|nr:ATP-binding cassette domain-containing protein [Desulfomonile tiedjei]AFM25826.1 ABC-type branched-chain amino acid transport systems, ATPase component [Desulfomonile tiedjei DSM 6799]
MLEVSNLMVFYENALALNDFSMKVTKGSIVAIIGSNSAGKTTLMNTLSGLIIDTKIKEQRKGGERITLYGTISLDGEDITELYPSERVKKGMVLCRERHPIFPESDLVENLRIAAYLRARSELKEAIEYVFHLFPTLMRLKTRKAGFLSGGEQQMLTIGMALMVKPRLLLLDEPLLGLSPLMQTTLVEAIKRIRTETGLTIVITEQFARPILPMIDHGYIIENGMLTLDGSGLELMENPEVRGAYFGV